MPLVTFPRGRSVKNFRFMNATLAANGVVG